MSYRCFACGRRTDEVEGGPTPEEVGQAHRWAEGVLDVHAEDGGCRAAVACWPCFWAIDPDLWIDAASWDAHGPLVPATRLPPMLEPDVVDFRHEDPASYPWPVEGDS